jgi:hypothetical protein
MEDSVRAYEEDLLSDARLSGHGISGGQTLSGLELLAYLQHNGAATRLLDFSASLLVAIWFASVEEPDVAGLVLGLSTTKRLSAREVLSSESAASLVAHAPDALLAFDPPPVSARIRAQYSVFAFGRTVDKVWGSLALPMDSDPILLFAVSPSLKREFLRWGATLFGLSQKTMFPDVPGFGAYQGASQPLTVSQRTTIERVLVRDSRSPCREWNHAECGAVADHGSVDNQAVCIGECGVSEPAGNGPEAGTVSSHDTANIQVQVLMGDEAVRYWSILNRAAGFPSLDLSSGRLLSPRGPLGTLRVRMPLATREEPERVLVPVDDADEQIACDGLGAGWITAGERDYIVSARSLAKGVRLCHVRALTDHEAMIFDDSARARLYWLDRTMRASAHRSAVIA